MISRIWVIVLINLCQACYFVDYFKDSSQETNAQTQIDSNEALGESLGKKAGSILLDELAAVHSVASSIPPAPIRPSAGKFPTQLLSSYRDKGIETAQLNAEINEYNLLLGGAPHDFSKDPAKDFDATAFLASLKVYENFCQALVAPNARQQSNWTSILPYATLQWRDNILFLAQRLLGKPSASISEEVLLSLKSILDNTDDGVDYTQNSYINVCVALLMDAEVNLL